MTFIDQLLGSNKNLTIDLAMAFDGVTVRFANRNLVFLGTSIEKGYDPLPLATGTCSYVTYSQHL